MVWGGEVDKNTGEIRPWTTWSEDGKSGKSNSYSGYRTTAEWKVRVRKTFYPKYKSEVIRQSTKRYRKYD